MSLVSRLCGGTAVVLAIAAPAAGQSVTRVTVGHNGAQPDGIHGVGVVSGDGRFVAFVSQAANLVASDANGGAADVFVRDLVAGTTTLVSLASDGQQRNAHSGALDDGGIITVQEHDISDDGRYVVFVSRGALVPGDTGECTTPPDTTPSNCPDVYLRDRQTNETVRISVAPGGANPNGPSFRPRISGNGRFVVFESAASNLVAGDTNGHTDVFLVDRQTSALTRVSVGTGGVQGDGPSTAPEISGDGNVIGFVSTAATLTAEPDPVACQPVPGATEVAPCRRPFAVDRALGLLVRVPMPAIETSGVLPGSTPVPYTVRVEARVVLPAPDGMSTAVGVGTTSTLRRHGIPMIRDRGWIHERVRGRIILDRPFITPTGWTGRVLAQQTFIQGPQAIPNDTVAVGVADVVTGLDESVPPGPTLVALMGNTSNAGRFVTYRTSVAVTGDDTDTAADVYVLDRDPDADGMPTAWETLFGLDPALADATGDPDTDGVVNQAEYATGGHPVGTHRRYLAEGAANAFFATRLDLANPGTSAVPVVVRLQGDDGVPSSTAVSVHARGHRTVPPDGRVSASFSAVVEASAPVVADRTMTWAGGFGSHAETSQAAPGTEWFLAEGATHGRFTLFYLLQNPGTSTATVDVTYLRPSPAAPVTRQYRVAPASRLTIAVDGIAELAATDVSARIASDLPILVERAMYLDTLNPVQVFGAGHAGAGLTATSTRWFLAEGATGSFFDLFYLIANPSLQATTARITYLLPTGPPLVRDYAVPAQSRVTIPVASQDPLLAHTPVSAIVESTTSTGLVVERSMWWPGQGQWTEGHLSAGSTVSAQRWALAGGLVDPWTDTFVLIANTTNTAGTVTVRTLPASPDVEPVVTTVAVPPNSRVSVPMRQFEPQILHGGLFGLLLESDGPAIVVERAVYTTVGDVVWAAGSAALGTPLP